MQISMLLLFHKNSVRISEHTFIFFLKNLSHSYTTFRKHLSIIQDITVLVSVTLQNFTYTVSLLNFNKLLDCQMPNYLGSGLRNALLNHKTCIQYLRKHPIFWPFSCFCRKSPTLSLHSSPYSWVVGIVYSYFGWHYEIHKEVICTLVSTFLT